MLAEGPSAARLALGTAQLGMPYGLARPAAVVSREQAREILSVAWDGGIDLLDTAATYGDSEAVIAAERPAGSSFSIVTKTLPVGAEFVGGADVARVAAGVDESLRRLKLDAVAGLLVHEATDLLAKGGERLFEMLSRLAAEGRVGKVGVSVYDPATLAAVLGRYPLKLVQLPLNVLDQRFAREGWPARLAREGVEVHVRSVFLQGLLLRPEDRFPCGLAKAAAPVMAFRRAAEACGLDATVAALLYAVRQPGVSRIVVGVDSSAALQSNLRAFAAAREWTGSYDFAPFAVEEPDIVDPRRWAA